MLWPRHWGNFSLPLFLPPPSLSLSMSVDAEHTLNNRNTTRRSVLLISKFLAKFRSISNKRRVKCWLFLFLSSMDGFNICITIFITIFPATLYKTIIFCSLFRETFFHRTVKFFHHFPFLSFVFSISTSMSLSLPGVINISTSPRLFRFRPSNFHKILALGAMQMAVNAFRLYIPFVRRVSAGGENERKREKEKE